MSHSLAADAPDILIRIASRRRQRLSRCEGVPGSGWERREAVARGDFLAALRGHRGHAIIAEVKMGSPRIGSLVGRIDPRRQARLYRDHGAAALSVVVEPDFFHGSYELLALCRTTSGLPVIAKDFLVDSRQLFWARDAGAAAILLVAALYERDELHRWAEEAEALGLTPLVETHDRQDVSKLVGRDWPLVGVNNRDLRTFDVDLERSASLVDQLPRSSLLVAESGIRSQGDVARLRAAGFDAFLIGESLLLNEDPAKLLRELAA